MDPIMPMHKCYCGRMYRDYEQGFCSPRCEDKAEQLAAELDLTGEAYEPYEPNCDPE